MAAEKSGDTNDTGTFGGIGEVLGGKESFKVEHIVSISPTIVYILLAIGAIVKKPAVLETKDGDVIAIRQLMFMSHSYDHRVVDGSLGGMFLKHVHDYLQNWDMNTEI